MNDKLVKVLSLLSEKATRIEREAGELRASLSSLMEALQKPKQPPAGVGEGVDVAGP